VANRTDRKRLWAKSGNRCAICRCLLTEDGHSGSPEAVVGEEAHIVGERPGSARYRPLPAIERDAYENRILLCPTDHTIVDKQPNRWSVEKLRARKREHEQSMRTRTADAESDGLHLDMPEMLMLETVSTGKQLLDIVGPVYAYVFDHDEMETRGEIDAAKRLVANAHDFGEIYSELRPADRIDAAEQLSEDVREAREAGILVLGKRITVDATYGRDAARDRWPVAVVRLRRLRDVGAEHEAAQEAEAALRDGGIEGLDG